MRPATPKCAAAVNSTGYMGDGGDEAKLHILNIPIYHDIDGGKKILDDRDVD